MSSLRSGEILRPTASGCAECVLRLMLLGLVIRLAAYLRVRSGQVYCLAVVMNVGKNYRALQNTHNRHKTPLQSKLRVDRQGCI